MLCSIQRMGYCVRYQPYDEDEGPRYNDTHDRYGEQRDFPEYIVHPESMLCTTTGTVISLVGLGIFISIILSWFIQ